jgi:hypothetical protein
MCAFGLYRWIDVWAYVKDEEEGEVECRKIEKRRMDVMSIW